MLEVRRTVPDPVNDDEAKEIQTRLAREIRQGQGFKLVAGVDVAYSKDDERAYVAAVVLSTTNWRPVADQRVRLSVPRTYDANLLGWREGPLVLEALTRLSVEPDLILVDGNGTAHPRKFGLACHVGYALDHPTVGVSKIWPRGCKDVKATVPRRRGTKTALAHEVSGDTLGYELYTQHENDPIYVSPGHRVSCDEAVSFVLRCAPWHQSPEPLRAAEELALKFRNEKEES